MKENNIPTAEEFYRNKHEDMYYFTRSYKEDMIEFAKFHVQAALKTASEKAELQSSGQYDSTWYYIDKDSILNAYPLENIK